MTTATNAATEKAARLAKARATRARNKAINDRYYARKRAAERPQPDLTDDEREILLQETERLAADIRVIAKYEETRLDFNRAVFDARYPEHGGGSPIAPETTGEDLLAAMDSLTLGTATDLGGGHISIDPISAARSRELTRAWFGIEDPKFFDLAHLSGTEPET